MRLNSFEQPRPRRPLCWGWLFLCCMQQWQFPFPFGCHLTSVAPLMVSCFACRHALVLHFSCTYLGPVGNCCWPFCSRFVENVNKMRTQTHISHRYPSVSMCVGVCVCVYLFLFFMCACHIINYTFYNFWLTVWLAAGSGERATRQGRAGATDKTDINQTFPTLRNNFRLHENSRLCVRASERVCMCVSVCVCVPVYLLLEFYLWHPPKQKHI